MKKMLALVVAVVMMCTIVGMVSACMEDDFTDDSDFSNRGITDKKLAEMIESGEIPHDIGVLMLQGHFLRYNAG